MGEEPFDEVTKEYNLAMKRILPQKGIEGIEILRKKINGQPVSASLVRKYLEEKRMEDVKKVVPEYILPHL